MQAVVSLLPRMSMQSGHVALLVELSNPSLRGCGVRTWSEQGTDKSPVQNSKRAGPVGPTL